MRSIIGVFLGAVAMTVLTAVAGGGTASAAADAAGFTAQAEAAGLSADKADALQDKVDGYLAEFKGQGRQVSPNQIDLGGAVLNVTVPGEAQPRQLAESASGVAAVHECNGAAYYEWFCAYQYENKGGDNIGMWSCGTYGIPWGSTGSWENNQTTGTRPVMNFTNNTSQTMPAAWAIQRTGVNWLPVRSIRNC